MPVFGTMAADVTHVVLGVAYQVSAAALALLLAAVFTLWYRSEGTLSIHSVTSGRREYFYWATVFVTFALGTAVGDLTAIVFGWGYLVSAVVFLGLILIPAVGWRFGLNAVFAFWSAYVLTRPLGASIADWLAADHGRGGLAWGYAAVSVGLILLAVGAVRLATRRATVLSPVAPPGINLGAQSTTVST